MKASERWHLLDRVIERVVTKVLAMFGLRLVSRPAALRVYTEK